MFKTTIPKKKKRTIPSIAIFTFFMGIFFSPLNTVYTTRNDFKARLQQSQPQSPENSVVIPGSKGEEVRRARSQPQASSAKYGIEGSLKEPAPWGRQGTRGARSHTHWGFAPNQSCFYV